MRYVSARPRVPPDAEASGVSERVSMMFQRGRLDRSDEICFSEAACVLLMWSLQVRVGGEGTSAEAMRYVSARLRAPPDVESSGTCRSEDVSTEAMRYVSARLRVPPDVESSGACRGEDVSAEAMRYVSARLRAPPDVESSGTCRGARTSRSKRCRYVSARLRAPPDVESSGMRRAPS